MNNLKHYFKAFCFIAITLMGLAQVSCGQEKSVAPTSELKFMDDLKGYYSDGTLLWRTMYYNDTLDVDIPGDGHYYMIRLSDKKYTFPKYPKYGMEFITDESNEKIIKINDFFPEEGGPFALISMGVNDETPKGQTCLAYAIEWGTVEDVQDLLDLGANVNFVTSKGLGMASFLIGTRRNHTVEASEKKYQIMKKNGFDINAKNSEGMTVLHLIANKARNNKKLKQLIALGADKTVTTEFGESAYDLASENEILQKKNIDINFLK